MLQVTCERKWNQCTVHLIIEESYERYTDQEAEYSNMMGYSLECTNWYISTSIHLLTF